MYNTGLKVKKKNFRSAAQNPLLVSTSHWRWAREMWSKNFGFENSTM
jgi:hypothetical protein